MVCGAPPHTELALAAHEAHDSTATTSASLPDAIARVCKLQATLLGIEFAGDLRTRQDLGEVA